MFPSYRNQSVDLLVKGLMCTSGSSVGILSFVGLWNGMYFVLVSFKERLNESKHSRADQVKLAVGSI